MFLRRILTPFLAAGLLVGLMSSAVFAADDTNVTVTGATFSITNPAVGDFTAVTLDGTAQTTTASFADFGVTDPRGTGDGWNITVEATQLKEWDPTLNAGVGDYKVGGRSMALSSLSMPAPTVAKVDSTSSPVPTLTNGPYSIDTASAVKVASAASGDGMGSYTFTQGGSLTLSIPASAYAAAYRSTVTVSLVTGP